jgi:SAM-dependent methyltransferase
LTNLPNHPSVGEQNYDGFTARYAATIQHHPIRLYYEKPAALQLMGQVQGLRVLDAGCGGGDYTLWLLEQGAHVTACDVMPDFVRLTQERTQGRAQVYRADLGQPLTFAPSTAFDLVVSFLTLHYLQDWAGVLGEFQRVLKPGGTLVFSCMHPMNDAPTVPYFNTELYPVEWSNFGNPPPVMHLYHRPLMAILNSLSAAGFVVTECLEPHPLPNLAQALPQEYAYLSQQPTFLFLKAVKMNA